MIRIVHVTTGLEAGGAERVLVDVASGLDRARYAPVVLSLTTMGPLARDLRSAGVPVAALEFNRRVPDPVRFGRLVRMLRAQRPDLVETWLYKADLIGGCAARLGTRAPVVWSIHGTAIPNVAGVRTNAAAQRIGARLSRWLPELILCVSQEAADAHQAMGYDARKLRVMPNGFDTDRFRPDPAAREAIRKELGVGPETAVVGLVARFDPQKDHATFAAAARRVVDELGDVRFVLCGREVTPENGSLTRMIDSAGLRDRTTLWGVRDDMPAVTAGFDVAVSSSAFGEAFSLALGEAMACGVPCVTTDVGNSARLVAGTGRVVPIRNPELLAGEIVAVLRLSPAERADAGARARARVTEEFSLPTVVRRYEEAYEEVLAASRGR